MAAVVVDAQLAPLPGTWYGRRVGAVLVLRRRTATLRPSTALSSTLRPQHSSLAASSNGATDAQHLTVGGTDGRCAAVRLNTATLLDTPHDRPAGGGMLRHSSVAQQSKRRNRAPNVPENADRNACQQRRGGMR